VYTIRKTQKEAKAQERAVGPNKEKKEFTNYKELGRK
jgi:hypothetical protein